MEFKLEYEPARFNATLSVIRKSFPYLNELSGNDLDAKKAALSAKLEAIAGSEVQRLAETLKSSELELVLSIISDTEDPETLSMLVSILVLRFRKKLFDLCWIMLQNNYRNTGLLNAAKVLMDCMKSVYSIELEASFLFKAELNKAESNKAELAEAALPEKARDMMLSEMVDIKGFLRKYHILENSRFAHEMRRLFFTACGADGFLKNKEQLIKHMDTDDINSAAAVFSSYLGKLKPIEYFDSLNRVVVNRWGVPGDGGEFWGRLDSSASERFDSWLDLKKIEHHFGFGSKRYKFWSMYFENMRGIRYDEPAGLLIMKFSNFIIVDNKDADGWSYLYLREYFAVEYANYEASRRQQETTESQHGEAELQQGRTEWRIIPEHVAEARDLVIEGIKSDIYRIGYDKVHILYLKDILKNGIGKKSPYSSIFLHSR